MKKIAFLILLILLPNCGKEKPVNKKNDYTLFKKGNTPPPSQFIEPAIPTKKEIVKTETNNETPELDFQVENATGKTIFVTCFSYIQKEKFVTWRWDKSPVYKIESGKSVSVDIDTISDTLNRDHTFGYLTIFNNEEDARNSIFELVDDEKKIDLDKIYELKGKKVVIDIEQYGFKKERLDPKVEDLFKKKALHPELDFIIENDTGKTIFVTAFVYQIKDNIRSVWNYDKTSILKLEQGQSGILDVDTITEGRDRLYMIATLGVFAAHQEQLARESTYELLEPRNKITLGALSRLSGNMVVIQAEQYGKLGDINEFDIRPSSSPITHKPVKIQPTIKHTQATPAQAKPAQVAPAQVTPAQQVLPAQVSPVSAATIQVEPTKVETISVEPKTVTPTTPKPRKNNGQYQLFS